MPVLCVSCHEDLDQHCARRCGWLACINRACNVRYVDLRDGRFTLKVAPDEQPPVAPPADGSVT